MIHVSNNLPWTNSQATEWHHLMTSSNGNISRVTGPLCGEFTGPGELSHTKASDAELWCFLWSALNKRLIKECKAGNLRRHHVHYDVTVMVDGCIASHASTVRNVLWVFCLPNGAAAHSDVSEDFVPHAKTQAVFSVIGFPVLKTRVEKYWHCSTSRLAWYKTERKFNRLWPKVIQALGILSSIALNHAT